jgi:hypothetical protein
MWLRIFTVWTTVREAGWGASRKASVAPESEEEEKWLGECAMPPVEEGVRKQKFRNRG